MAKQNKSSTPLWRFLFVVYAATLLLLLFNRGIDWVDGLTYRQQLQRNISLVPFHTIGNYWTVVKRMDFSSIFFHCVINLGGNIFLFIPIGYFLPRLWVNMRRFFPFFFTCTLSICLVELLQLFTLLGSLDIDDLILNLFGMIVGYLIYMIFKKQR